MHEGKGDPEETDYGERVFGKGVEQLDGSPLRNRGGNIKATGVAGRAKQFVPFAALRGFCEMVEEVSRSHDNIDQHQDDQEG